MFHEFTGLHGIELYRNCSNRPKVRHSIGICKCRALAKEFLTQPTAAVGWPVLRREVENNDV